LERCDRNGDNLFNHIITGDETWIHHFEWETKCQEHAMEAHIILQEIEIAAFC
jgi:hypothetical protein